MSVSLTLQIVCPPFCRRCTDQLLQAAVAAAGSGGAQPQDASAVAALRCSRCMALMLQIVKQGQVRYCLRRSEHARCQLLDVPVCGCR